MKKLLLRFKDIHDPIWYVVFVVAAIIILITPYIFTLSFGLIEFTPDTGAVGDTFGITAPFIGLLSALLVFMAFQAQIKANRQFQLDREQSNIMELFQMLDDEITNLKMSNVSGHKVIDMAYSITLRCRMLKADEIKYKEDINRLKTIRGKWMSEREKARPYVTALGTAIKLTSFTLKSISKYNEPFFFELVHAKYSVTFDKLYLVHKEFIVVFTEYFYKYYHDYQENIKMIQEQEKHYVMKAESGSYKTG